jgi:hypothetical protein
LSVSDQAGVDENKEVFYIVRWMIDPSLGLDTMPTQSDANGSSTGTAAGSDSASAGSAGAGAPSGGIQ